MLFTYQTKNRSPLQFCWVDLAFQHILDSIESPTDFLAGDNERRGDADNFFMSSAACKPTRRGRRCVPPIPGMSPSCTSGWPSDVFG